MLKMLRPLIFVFFISCVNSVLGAPEDYSSSQSSIQTGNGNSDKQTAITSGSNAGGGAKINQQNQQIGNNNSNVQTAAMNNSALNPSWDLKQAFKNWMAQLPSSDGSQNSDAMADALNNMQSQKSGLDIVTAPLKNTVQWAQHQWPNLAHRNEDRGSGLPQNIIKTIGKMRF